MKKALIIVAALIAAATAVSCNKNNIEEPGVPGLLKFTCTLPSTKFAIDDQGKTAWEPGDQIFVHAGTSGNKSITVTLKASDISNAGKTATISFTEDQLAPYVHYSGGVQDYNSTYYIIYPASAAYTGSMYYNTRIVNYDKPVMGGYNNGSNFILHNLCGIIKYKVSGDFDSYELVGNNDERVSWTEYQVRLALDSSDNEIFVEKPTSDGANMLPLTSATGPVVADGTTDNWLVFPGGVSFSGGFTIKFKKAGSTVKVASTQTAFSVGVGDFLNMGNISSNLKDFVAPSSSSHSSALSTDNDLSAKQANCFVITEAGTYKFPAYKGGSSTSPGNVFGVELLWETYNNAETVTENSVIEAVDFDGPTNYIYFKTPATLKPGNALIAAKDYEDHIIWSWHIWIPSTAIADTKCGDESGSYLMDRNLGALVTTPTDLLSHGLIYQWGRKDPFVSSPGTDSKDAATSFNTITKSAGPVSYNTAKQNPTTVYYNNVYPRDWVDPQDASLWGSSKTVNDPCPAGYKIPSRNDNALFKTTATVCDATTGTATANGYTFPLAGYRDKETGAMYKVKERVRFWNYDVRTKSSGYGLGYMAYFYDTSQAPSTSEWRSYGCSVRCVKE